MDGRLNGLVAIQESGVLSAECSYAKMPDSGSESINVQVGVKVNILSRLCEFAQVFIAVWFSPQWIHLFICKNKDILVPCMFHGINRSTEGPRVRWPQYPSGALGNLTTYTKNI